VHLPGAREEERKKICPEARARSSQPRSISRIFYGAGCGQWRPSSRILDGQSQEHRETDKISAGLRGARRVRGARHPGDNFVIGNLYKWRSDRRYSALGTRIYDLMSRCVAELRVSRGSPRDPSVLSIGRTYEFSRFHQLRELEPGRYVTTHRGTAL
jgi:hypothetical protein